jgi:hypothetical protein
VTATGVPPLPRAHHVTPPPRGPGAPVTASSPAHREPAPADKRRLARLQRTMLPGRQSDSDRRLFTGALPDGAAGPDHHVRLDELGERLEDAIRRVDAADAVLNRRWCRRARSD